MFPRAEVCIKVRKEIARRIFDSGYNVYVVPCHIHPIFDWTELAEVWNKETLKDTCNTFNRAVENYKYNVCNAEVGYYPHYYIEKDDFVSYHKAITRRTTTPVETGGLMSAT